MNATNPFTHLGLDFGAARLPLGGHTWHLAWASAQGISHAKASLPKQDAFAYACARPSVAAPHGQIASRAAVQAVCDFSGCATEGAQVSAHAQGLEPQVRAAIARHSAARSATTLAAAWLAHAPADLASEHGLHGHILSVGDVRAYRFSPQRGLQALTTDQSFTQLAELPPQGVSAYNPARKLGNGMADPLLPGALQSVTLHATDWLLLATDGVHAAISEYALDALLTRQAQRCGRVATSCTNSLRTGKMLGRIVLQALQNGTNDDASALLLWCGN
jgi:serine/threonine protein phosphatase PrpC